MIIAIPVVHLLVLIFSEQSHGGAPQWNNQHTTDHKIVCSSAQSASHTATSFSHCSEFDGQLVTTWCSANQDWTLNSDEETQHESQQSEAVWPDAGQQEESQHQAVRHAGERGGQTDCDDQSPHPHSHPLHCYAGHCRQYHRIIQDRTFIFVNNLTPFFSSIADRVFRFRLINKMFWLLDSTNYHLFPALSSPPQLPW